MPDKPQKPPKAPTRKKPKRANFTDPDGEPVCIRKPDEVFALTGNGSGGTFIYARHETFQVAQPVDEVNRVLDGDPEPDEIPVV